MSTKKNKPVANNSSSADRQTAQQSTAKQGGPRPVAKNTESAHGIAKLSNQLLIAGGIAVLLWLFLNNCLNNQLTNWDDPGYIKDNALIKDVSAEGLQRIFSTSVMGNYHPLTILSYAIEYSYVRLQPWLYHLDSLLFHILTTLLVYWFVSLLTRRPIAGAVTALLFGLHPMHMESVAWLAGRKDVVYGAFYIGACIAWVYYVRAARGAKAKWYITTALLFICSLLAKPVAVTLPLTLLLINYFEGKRLLRKADPGDEVAGAGKPGINMQLLLEQAPFFIISIGFGIKSIFDQKAFDALLTQKINYNVLERIALGGYALVTYLWKAVAPLGLSCFYPYPEKVHDGTLPFIYFIYPVIVAVLIFVVFRFARRNKVVVFGFLFFLVNIILLLQFIPVGGAILADRYSYISYLGLFFMAGWLVSDFFQAGAKKELGYAALGAVLVYSLVLGYLSNKRCAAWYDTVSLWRDEIEQQPDAPNAYNNLGFEYFNRLNESVDPAARKVYFDSSLMLLNKAIELQKNFANPYVSLGELHRGVGKFPEAKVYYYEALKLHDKEGTANAYLGLGIIYAITQNFDSSAFCFRSCIAAKPYFPEAHSNFGNFYDMTHQSDSALREYATAIAQNPDMYAPHVNRGRLLQRLKRCDEAMKDFEIALQLNPNMGEIYYARSYCATMRGDKAQALRDVEQALSLGFRNIDNNYYQMLKGK